MEQFPQHKINPLKALMSGDDGDMAIEIILSPFQICADGYSETVDSSVILDCIPISSALPELEGKTFEFPVNPDEGYIDGSIYFFAAHNPVDVINITFGYISNNQLPIKLYSKWVLEFENTGFQNFDYIIETNIEL